MIIAPILSSLLPILVSSQSQTASDSILRPDSTVNTADSLSSAILHSDSLWSVEYSFLGGFASVDFPERSKFVSDLNSDAADNKWTIDQPFGASDIGPRAGLEFAVRRKDRFRLSTAVWYQGWSAQAIARAADGTLNHRSYGSDLMIGSVGADLLISKSILRLDAGRDAFLGGRFLAGTGRLEGRNPVWATAIGFSLASGAEFLDWKRWAVAGQLGLDWLSLRSDSPWSKVLWNSSNPNPISWSGGGLSLMLSLRWGSPHDSIPGNKTTLASAKKAKSPQQVDSMATTPIPASRDSAQVQVPSSNPVQNSPIPSGTEAKPEAILPTGQPQKK